jgi:hypothetical protein
MWIRNSIIIIVFLIFSLSCNSEAFDQETAKILVRSFYNKLILNERISYEEGLMLFGNSLQENVLEQKYGYRNAKGKLIRKPDYYLLWDCFLQKRHLFIPNELKFKESRVEIAIGTTSSLFAQKGMQGKIIATIIIMQKDNSFEKIHYDILALYLGRQPSRKLAINIGFSTLNGKKLVASLLGDLTA